MSVLDPYAPVPPVQFYRNTLYSILFPFPFEQLKFEVSFVFIVNLLSYFWLFVCNYSRDANDIVMRI